MKKLFFVLLVISSFGWSCSENEHHKAADSGVVVSHKQLNADINKTVANLTIQGMTCAEGCGGKIQQDLQSLKGITLTNLDFASDRPENVVSVEYNPETISESEMIKCVDAISDGKYKVNAVEVIHYTAAQSASGSSSSDVSHESFGTVFQVLNLLQSLSKMIQE